MTDMYTLECREGVTLVRFSHFDRAGLAAHGITTRLGGVSQGSLAALNMGRRGVEQPERLQENHRRAATALGVSPGSFVFSDQVHGVALRAVTLENRARPVRETDGLLTDTPGVTLATVYADCQAVLLYDPVRRAIGMAHAGWRGAAQGIGPLLVQAMGAHYGSKPQDLLAALGPAIGPCCFEVGPEVPAAFDAHGVLRENRHWLIETGGKPRLDLWHINRLLLQEAGVRPEAISAAELCTCCRPELFFSHRRDHGDTGRMAALMALGDSL